MIILGIETSCDETAASIIEGKNGKIKILSSVISSQIDIHTKWGGVVPEVAAREHVLNILPVIDEALERANILPLAGGDLPREISIGNSIRVKGGKKCKQPHPASPLRGGAKSIDAIAVNYGPGLITSLITGIETAKTLSYAWGIPLIATNHIESHIYANFLDEKKIKFPALVLTVSGGHNMLVLMDGHNKLKTIGETRDDAAGEAFDKAAQLLGLGYPGGPKIAAEAAKITNYKLQITNKSQKSNSKKNTKIILPRPMMHKPGYDFSFSGLKTALLYEIKKDKNWKKKIPEYAHEFQQAIIDVLIHKTIKAGKEHKAKTIMLAGGVSANAELRKQMTEKIKKELDIDLLIPDLNLTTDNATMGAIAGYYKARDKKFIPWQKIKVDCNAKLN